MVSLISLNEDVFTLIFDQINLPTLINLNCVCSTLKNLTTEKLQNKKIMHSIIHKLYIWFAFKHFMNTGMKNKPPSSHPRFWKETRYNPSVFNKIISAQKNKPAPELRGPLSKSKYYATKSSLSKFVYLESNCELAMWISNAFSQNKCGSHKHNWVEESFSPHNTPLNHYSFSAPNGILPSEIEMASTFQAGCGSGLTGFHASVYDEEGKLTHSFTSQGQAFTCSTCNMVEDTGYISFPGVPGGYELVADIGEHGGGEIVGAGEHCKWTTGYIKKDERHQYADKYTRLTHFNAHMQLCSTRAWGSMPDVHPDKYVVYRDGHDDTIISGGIIHRPDGSIDIATTSADCTVRIWDSETGIQKLVIVDTNIIASCIILPNCDIVCGTDANVLKIWNTVNGSEITTLRGHTHNVRGCDKITRDDGSTDIVSTSFDHTIKIWSTIS